MLFTFLLARTAANSSDHKLRCESFKRVKFMRSPYCYNIRSPLRSELWQALFKQAILWTATRNAIAGIAFMVQLYHLIIQLLFFVVYHTVALSRIAWQCELEAKKITEPLFTHLVSSSNTKYIQLKTRCRRRRCHHAK
jgi:hypothetical protein